MPLEVLGVELCTKALRMGGRAGIVLPESILNTRQMQHVRDYILRHFDVLAVLSLPPQTFAPFEGVGKASVLFLQKTDRTVQSRTVQSHRVFLASPEHIGYDNTGRHSDRNDLPTVATTFVAFKKGQAGQPGRVAVVDQSRLAASFTYSALLTPTRDQSETVPLGELCITMICGSTPPKKDYTQRGCRILKVGDLSGAGLDWEPRDRAFVDPRFLRNRAKRVELGDILLTAAAHHPKYIGLDSYRVCR